MKALLFLLLLGSWLPVAGQAAGPRLGQAAADTARYGWVRQWEKQLALPAVAETTTDYYFRLTDSNGRVLDSWQQRGKWAGQLTLWVADADDALFYHNYRRLYVRQYALGQEQADSAGMLLKTSRLLTIPSEEHLAGWQNGQDGYSFEIQYRDSSGYQLAHYWSPRTQRGVPEAALVEQTCKALLATTNYKTVFRAFVAGIPFPEYTTFDGNTHSWVGIKATATYWQRQREVARFLRQQRREGKR